MTKIYIMCGVPASGKSTLRAKLLKNSPNAFVYSTDDYIEDRAREEGKTYNEVFSEAIKGADKAISYYLGKAIREGKDIIWDQTNLTPAKRRKIVNRIVNLNNELDVPNDLVFLIEAVRLPEKSAIADWVELARRIKGRPGKVIPFDVVTSMVDNYVLPTSEEADIVTYYNIYGEIVHG